MSDPHTLVVILDGIIVILYYVSKRERGSQIQTSG